MTKARALGVIRKGHVSRFGPGSHPGRPLREAVQGLSTTRKASKMVSSHTGMNLPLCCQIYRMLVCIYMW